jgi:hypothetical protein
LFCVNELVILVDALLLELDRFPGHDGNGPPSPLRLSNSRARPSPSHTICVFLSTGFYACPYRSPVTLKFCGDDRPLVKPSVARHSPWPVLENWRSMGYGCQSGVSVPVRLANGFAYALKREKGPYSSSTLGFAICSNALFIFVNLASSDR